MGIPRHGGRRGQRGRPAGLAWLGLRRSVVDRASPEREGAGHSHAAPGGARGGPGRDRGSRWERGSRRKRGSRRERGSRRGDAGRALVRPQPGAAGPVVFANWADQRLYRLDPDAAGSAPRPVTPVPAISAGMRFADLFIHPGLDEIWCVRETLTGPAPTDVRRDIVAVPLGGSAADDPGLIRVLAASHHFLCCPRLSPDGERLSWIGWDHPSMPWDETVLCVAEVTGGKTGPQRVVAGGGRQAIVQAEWAGPRTLVYVSDPEGWWNLYRLDTEGGTPQALCPREEEFGGAA